MSEGSSVEARLLLEGIFLKFGYDFRSYAEASLGRRIEAVQARFQIKDEMELLAKLLKEPEFFREVLPYLTVSTTEMFRDPAFFRSLRENVMPRLRTYPTVNVWLAGCSTGEEVYSMAILLREEGLAERATVFATDLNPMALEKARHGIYDLETVKTFTKNYTAAGGTRSPSDYYTAEYGSARFRPFLRENVTFAEHNLVTDFVFAETHLILCRNVMIYFDRDLQERALGLFHESLIPHGFLGLGSKETVRFSGYETSFRPLDAAQKIYQKDSRPWAT